jgi:transcriptional regulator with XRE-family HTH domain
MEHEQANQFGGYLKHLREERRFSIRELARKAELDSGALTRLESNKTAPAPRTLKALSAALDVPLADLFAMAGFTTPHDLPTMNTYFHARYGHLPEDVLASMNDYCERIISVHGFDPDGPVALEDETKEPSNR